MRYSQLQRLDVDIAFYEDPSLPSWNRTDGRLTYLLGVEERSNPGILIGDMGCHDANPRTEEVGYMLLDEFGGKVMPPRLRKLISTSIGVLKEVSMTG
jgi:hypothetical protein